MSRRCTAFVSVSADEIAMVNVSEGETPKIERIIVLTGNLPSKSRSQFRADLVMRQLGLE